VWAVAFYSADPAIGSDIDNGEMRTVLRSNCRYFKLINTGKALYQSVLSENSKTAVQILNKNL
jgi:hypothetical protein